LVGSLIEYVEGTSFMDYYGAVSFYRFVSGVEIRLSARADVAHKAFDGFQILQLNFSTRVPWVLDEPELEDPLSQ